MRFAETTIPFAHLSIEIITANEVIAIINGR